MSYCIIKQINLSVYLKLELLVFLFSVYSADQMHALYSTSTLTYKEAHLKQTMSRSTVKADSSNVMIAIVATDGTIEPNVALCCSRVNYL